MSTPRTDSLLKEHDGKEDCGEATYFANLAGDLLEHARTLERELAARERDKQDAERYRWLRGQSCVPNDDRRAFVWVDPSTKRAINDAIELDAAIDTARSARKEG